jgi:hypothetical protein
MAINDHPFIDSAMMHVLLMHFVRIVYNCSWERYLSVSY